MAELVLVDKLTIQQGDDRPVTWTLAETSGGEVNLTGYTVLAQVRAQAESSTVLHEWSTELGNAVISGASITLKVDDSENWPWTFGFYDLFLTDPLGFTIVPVRGSVTVIPAVTRRTP